MGSSVETALFAALDTMPSFVKTAPMQATDGLQMPSDRTKSERTLNP